MLATEKHLLAAGPPDVVDSKDPLGAFEGRKGGLLYVISGESGEKLFEFKLSSPPVFNGIAAARSKLYLSLENGTIISFGKK